MSYKFWDFWKEGTKSSTMRIMLVLACVNVFAITTIRSIRGDDIDWYGIAAFIGVFVTGKVAQKIWGENTVSKADPISEETIEKDVIE
jgi:hypothetical protein